MKQPLQGCRICSLAFDLMYSIYYCACHAKKRKEPWIFYSSTRVSIQTRRESMPSTPNTSVRSKCCPSGPKVWAYHNTHCPEGIS